MRKVCLSLLLVMVMVSPTAKLNAQSPTEEIVALLGNNTGGSALVTFNGTTLRITQQYHDYDYPTTRTGRDVYCVVTRIVVTACGQFVYAAVGCNESAPELFTFQTRAVFPCAQPTVIYIPIVQR